MPFSTEDPVDHPVSLYAATKKSNELFAYAYSKLYNIPSTGLRFLYRLWTGRKTDLRTGLRNFVQWYQEFYGQEENR